MKKKIKKKKEDIKWRSQDEGNTVHALCFEKEEER